MSKAFSHLTYEQRQRIKEMLDKNRSKADIATALAVHIATVYREIRRGSVNGEYAPGYSEDKYQERKLSVGRKSILAENPALAQHVAQLIVYDRLSPERVIERLQQEGEYKDFPCSTATIYSAIDHGLIPGVTRETLRANVTVYSNGTVHIAKWVQENLDLHDGDLINFEIEKGRLCLSKLSEDEMDYYEFRR